MKRIICVVVVLLLCMSLLAVTAFAASATAKLTGPSTVRAGDTITLNFNLNGSGIYAASGTLEYDSNVLELKSTKQRIGNGWVVEFNSNNFAAYDNNLEKPINKNTELFTVTFKVKSNVAIGTAIKVSCIKVLASDGNADINVGTVTYSTMVAAPKSTDNALKSLTVSNTTISPAFSTGTTSYTAEVPFEVSKLDVKAVANDSKAKVDVNSPNLMPGGTTAVTVTVTAENGSTKTYTISVKREQDPNYVASNNNNLSGIDVDGFLLSPVFSADKTEYVIWLPFETENVTISGTCADSRANLIVEGGNNLVAGADNEIKVICVAEDGTQKVYTVIAKRAAAHDGSTEPTEPPEPSKPSEPTQPSRPSDPTDSTETTHPTTPPEKYDEQPKENNVLLMLIFGAVCFAVGLAVGLLIGKRKK